MDFNLAYDGENISEDSGPVTEPVTLQEVKDYLRLEGFQDDDDSPADDFVFDDTLIETMIQAAREWCEAKTGLSLVWKRMQVPVTNSMGGISLPYGPVIGTVTAVDSEGDEIVSNDIKLTGTKFPSLRLPKKANMVLTYDVGYNILTCPGGLKDAIKAHVAACYDNRGDEGKADLSLAGKLCGPYIRSGMFA